MYRRKRHIKLRDKLCQETLQLSRFQCWRYRLIKMKYITTVILCNKTHTLTLFPG